MACLDYRDVTGTFDKIVSVGMFEHVGGKNYRTFMETARRVAGPSGVVPAAHHRVQHQLPVRGSLDIHVHLSQGPAAVHGPDLQGLRGVVRGRGLAQPGAPLRQDPHGLARQGSWRPGPIWPSRIPSGFRRMWEYYLLVLRRGVSGPGHSAVADPHDRHGVASARVLPGPLIPCGIAASRGRVRGAWKRFDKRARGAKWRLVPGTRGRRDAARQGTCAELDAHNRPDRPPCGM